MYSGISDFRVSKLSLCRRDTRGQACVSHWIEDSRVMLWAVSAHTKSILIPVRYNVYSRKFSIHEGISLHVYMYPGIFIRSVASCMPNPQG